MSHMRCSFPSISTLPETNDLYLGPHSLMFQFITPWDLQLRLASDEKQICPCLIEISALA